MEKYERAEKKGKKRRRRKAIVYILSCICFGAPLAIFLLVTNLAPKATTPIIMCQNETGNCIDNSYKHNVGCYVNDTIIDSNGGSTCTTKCIDSLTYKCNCPLYKIWDESLLTCSLMCQNETGNCIDNSYKHNVSCYVNDTIIDSNGGSACTTKCIDSLTYTCNCPSNKIWEESVLTCSLKCLNETANCEIYTSGNHCIPATDTNNGMDCKTNCNNSIGSFECSCETNYQWDMKSQTCVLNCTNSLTMACTEITAVSVKCVDPIISENDDPNSLKLSDCIAYCPVNGITLDYKCNCVKNYLWRSIDRICVLECKLNTSDSCDEYPTETECMLPIPGANISRCFSICDGGLKTDYLCTCLNGLEWARNDYECLENCPKTYSECVPTKTYGFRCSYTRVDRFSKNCIAKCNQCYPINTCECIPNQFKNEIWDEINVRCAIACSIDPNDTVCAQPYRHNGLCYLQNAEDQFVSSCFTTCSATGRSYRCYCLSGNVFSPSDNTCNNNCREVPNPPLSYCNACFNTVKPGIDCKLNDKTCKTICEGGHLLYNASTCQ